MSAILRIVRCLLGIASPSRIMMIVCGDASRGTSWLDRWERRINEDAARRFVPVYRRDVVNLYRVDESGVVAIVMTIDVTGRSDRAQRRLRNKWARRAAGTGYGVRLATRFA